VNTTSARENQEKIVVGVDGSGHSGQALSWAAREATLRSASLEVIYAFPALVSLVGSTAHEYYPQVEKEAAQVLDRALADAPVDASVPMERVLVPGSPAKVLVEASDNASMLVVGSRGLGEFRGMLLGSVSIHCVQQARCPVVVVRSGSREAP
jgi:nucleotide-binding universal stress UspA family protein